MSTLKLIGSAHFIGRLTGNRLSTSQLNRVTAYLRAKKVVLYDEWSREHCMILDNAQINKPIVIEALKVALN